MKRFSLFMGLWLVAVGCLAQDSRASDLPETIRDPETAVMAGKTMENERHWSDAVDLYRAALKKWPNNAHLSYGLRRSHSLARIESRYDDLSFRESLKNLPLESGLQLFSSVHQMIQAHFVDPLDTTSIVAHGTESLWLALGNEKFLDNNLFGVDQTRLKAFRKELQTQYWNKPARGQFEATNLIREICQLAMERVGLEPGPICMEYTFGACNCLDEYSTVMTPGRLRDLFNNIDGQFVGVGIVMEADLGQGIKLRQVLPESPAAEAGLKSGDLLVGIDNHDCRAMTTDEAASYVTGQPGSQVTLVVVRPGAGRVTAKCTRREVIVRSIPIAKIVDASNGIGYIQLTGFQKSTVMELDMSLNKLKQQGMQSLILDVRQNPGGLLTTAVDLLDRFIADGVLVSTKGREPSQNQTHTAHGPGTWNLPIVLLIDENSASASEIVAGAFRDHHRAKIVGRNSYGKWTVQSIYDNQLGFGCGIRMTTAKFYSPNGDTLSKIGVKPDIEIPAEKAAPHIIGEVDPVADLDVRTAIEQLQKAEYTQR